MIKSLKLGPKLVAAFMLVGLVPLIILGIISTMKTKESLHEAALSQMTSGRELKVRQLEAYFGQRFNDIATLASNPSLVRAMRSYNESYRDGILSSSYRATDREYTEWLTGYLKQYGYYDIFLISSNGDITYTVTKEPDFNTNIVSGPWASSNLGELFRKAKSGPAVTDYASYEPSKGIPAAFIGTPVYSESKTYLGVLAFQLSLEQIDAIMQEHEGFPQSVDAFLVGSDFLMRTQSRLTEENTILEQKVATEEIEAAAQGKTGAFEFVDYRGIHALGAFAPVTIHGLTWYAVSKVDRDEAMATADNLVWIIGGLSLVLGVIVAIFGWFFARSIARPVQEIATLTDQLGKQIVDFGSAVNSIARNDLTRPISNVELTTRPTNRQDEIGQLTRSVHTMLGAKVEMAKSLESMRKNLCTTVGQLNDSSVQVASAATEISSTAEQMAKGAEDQSSQVERVAASIEEISANIVEAGRTTGDATTASEKAAKIAADGGQIVQNTVTGMQRIAEVVESVGHSIQKLSNSASQIGEIVTVIDDIADQTNLLALNAAIEAARAGEQGRGFAVVADEVRKLAERTSKATGEITKMIRGIQNDTSTAVDSMQAGIHEVELGREMAQSAGKSLEQIISQVDHVLNMMQHISSAATEQSQAAEEIARNVSSISNVTRENASGVRQSAVASVELSKEAERLKTVVGQFKLPSTSHS